MINLKQDCRVLFYCDDIHGMTSTEVASIFSKCSLDIPTHVTKAHSNQNYCYLHFEDNTKASCFYYSYRFKENICKRFRNSSVQPLREIGGKYIVYDLSLYEKQKRKNFAKSCKCVLSSVTTSESSSRHTTNNIGTANVNTNGDTTKVNTNGDTTKVNTKDNTTQTDTSNKTTDDTVQKTRDIVKRLISDVNEEIKTLEEKLKREKKRVKLLQDVYDI